VQGAGAEVQFLPTDSADLNPIEKMWSKIKSLLRSAEARTPENLTKTSVRPSQKSPTMTKDGVMT